ncbi:MAG: UvrD-helicase domain-containing protein [Syntrophomonadaceae bacterium]|nr:UvrD-helicase domain-containing protein [Syntrophomonadaceae bacterium]
MKNIKIINASAGSGKTHSITRKIVDAINSGTRPEEIIATTFTNRAARELKERIKGELLADHKLEEANLIYDAYIGTVNSICGRLLEEYALEAGLSPNLKVISEEDGNHLFNIAIENAINKISPHIEPIAYRLGLDGKGNYYQKDSDWRNDVREITEIARRNKISAEQLQACKESSLASIFQYLDLTPKSNLNQELERLLNETLGNQTLSSQKASFKGDSIKCMEKIDYCAQNMNKLSWKDWADLADNKPSKNERDILSPINKKAAEVLHHPQLHKDVSTIIEGVFDCAIDSLDAYANYKKAHGLIDFIDQEAIALDLLSTNQEVAASVKERLKFFVVDEFQDTSPIQLALFLTLSQIIEKSVWVGDPKQSIYGFRDADPSLMQEVVKKVTNKEILDYSWRSRENLVNFTNALFSQAFHHINPSEVILQIPNERKHIAQNGSLEIWYLNAPKKEIEIEALVKGVQDLIQRDIKPGDIAVLCRTNDNCKNLADTLEEAGIRTSLGQTTLLEAYECHYALSALKYMTNPRNNLALIELVNILYPQKTDWLKKIMDKPKDISSLWADEDLLKTLKAANPQVKYWTPLEALEQAINKIDLINKIKVNEIGIFPNPESALNNLEALKKHCQEYTTYSSSYMHTPTIDGFIAYLNEKNPSQAQIIDENAVNILTYHGAKGLEWPWVILADLNTSVNSTIFGVHIEPAANFDPKNPLENRKIHYWPWPFGAKKSFSILDEKTAGLSRSKEIQKLALEEAQRLLYVAMTRPKDGLVITLRKAELKSGPKIYAEWLNILTDKNHNPIVNWQLSNGVSRIVINNSILPIKILEFSGNFTKLATVSNDVYFIEIPTPPCQTEYSPARVNPSSPELGDNDDIDTGDAWKEIHNFNQRINIKGKPEMDHLGNAIHGYLAIDSQAFSESKRLEVAQRLIRQWKMESTLEASEIVIAGKNLMDFLEQNYRDYKIFREWPIVWVKNNGQLLQGWIDMMLELPDGYVIIDHKSYPGKNSESRVKKYAPQLGVYKQAVEKSTGKTVKEVLIYLPVSGLIMKMS